MPSSPCTRLNNFSSWTKLPRRPAPGSFFREEMHIEKGTPSVGFAATSLRREVNMVHPPLEGERNNVTGGVHAFEVHMKTLILNITDENDPRLEEAARILREGGTVIFPTETVYGLGANGLSEEAVRKIYAAKGRPSDNPIILHIAGRDQLFAIVSEVTSEAEKLADAFWPGPLTMILPKADSVPDTVTGGLKTVAVRLPEHPVARRLIALSGVPVAAPSANLSGKPSPTCPEHVLQDMDGRVDCILCGDHCSGGVESTVVDMTATPPMVLRPGGVSLEDLQRVIPGIQLDPGLTELDEGSAPKSPGMKYTHYAPNAPMTLYTGAPEKVGPALRAGAQAAVSQGKRTAVLAVIEHRELFGDLDVIFYDLGSEGHPHEAAKLLFNRLRACNTAQVDVILAEGVPEHGVGRAVMNRMRKAAGNHVVVVK